MFTTPLVCGKERLGHPTQKSIRLMEDLIKIHTNVDDLIIDPFMGVGTTGEACLSQNRNFIGVELDKTYYNSAVERMQKFKL